MSKSERAAIEIALDELDSYIGVMSQDIRALEGEVSLEKLEWASKKLHKLLEQS
jgi:hypothetical protein